jgi:hypothetical protein
MGVVADRSSDAGDDEGGQRERPVERTPVGTNRTSHPGDIDLEQRVHDVPALHQIKPVDRLALQASERLDLITVATAGSFAHVHRLA